MKQPWCACAGPRQRALELAQRKAAAAAQLMQQQRAEQGVAGVRVPKTSTEFETAWKGFRGDMDQQERYLRAIPPASLPFIFKTSLTAQILAGFLDTLLTRLAAPGASSTDVALAASMLAAFHRVPRFAMTCMGLGSKDRAVLAPKWAAAAPGLLAADKIAVEELARLLRI